MLKHAALAGIWLALAAGAIAQTPGNAQSGKTLTGATFSIAEGWTEHVTRAVVVLDPPETDTHVAIVDVTQAADASLPDQSVCGRFRSNTYQTPPQTFRHT